MLGAIAGDVIGSRFEGRPTKSKSFELFSPESTFTDDTVLTVAVADCLLNDKPYGATFREYYHRYPYAGYGGRFQIWAATNQEAPYYSFGNGSAMRVSPVGWFFPDLETVLDQAEQSAAVTHNHPEGIKGAQAVAGAIHAAAHGQDKAAIKDLIRNRFGYDLDRSMEEIRPGYGFDVTCQGSVPEALIAFFQSEDFEDAIRNAVSLGGDSDTQACMAGAVAEAYYGHVPPDIRQAVLSRLDQELRQTVLAFEQARA